MIRRILFSILLAAAVAVPSARAQKAVYVATDGSVLGSGGISSPVNSIATALGRVVPGDTIYVRGGTYASPSSIRIDDSGEENAYLYIWAYADETPVFDFTGANRGFDIRGSYLHLKGLTAENSGDNGIYVKRASYNILEQMTARYNGDSGVQVEDQSAYNLLLNVDSYGNYDPGRNGENADGFAIKFGVGPGNVLRGCRAWGNSDDGYDFWSRDDLGQQGVTVEDSWAFDNGYNNWGDSDFQGDSNGFKLGHGPGPHVLIRNVSWGHRAHGFDINGNTSGVTLYNNTAVMNDGSNFYFDWDTNVAQGESVLRNNAAFGDVLMDDEAADDAYNSWNSGVAYVYLDDFVSLDPAGADGPRQADGSLPELDFAHLVAGSDLVDAGIDVGLPYEGAAPDLGAFERSDVGTAVGDDAALPAGFALLPNYPNPFNPATRLTYRTAAAGPVHLAVYDALGRRVAVLVDAVMPAGTHEAVWNAAASRFSSGVYVARLDVGGRADVVRMVLLK